MRQEKVPRTNPTNPWLALVGTGLAKAYPSPQDAGPTPGPLSSPGAQAGTWDSDPLESPDPAHPFIPSLTFSLHLSPSFTVNFTLIFFFFLILRSSSCTFSHTFALPLLCLSHSLFYFLSCSCTSLTFSLTYFFAVVPSMPFQNTVSVCPSPSLF